MIGVGGGIDILPALYDAASDRCHRSGIRIWSTWSTIAAAFTGYPGTGSTQCLRPKAKLSGSSNAEQFDVIQGIGLDNIAALEHQAYVLRSLTCTRLRRLSWHSTG